MKISCFKKEKEYPLPVMGKHEITVYNNIDCLINSKKEVDIYILSLLKGINYKDVHNRLKKKHFHAKIIYLINSIEDLKIIQNLQPCYFLIYPFSSTDLYHLLNKIENNFTTIKIIRGEKLINLDEINYINIIGRSLGYHLTNGETFNGISMRSSFSKETKELLNYSNLFFIAPAFIINLDNIDTIQNTKVKFKNGDTTYLARSAMEKLLEKWKSYITE